MGTIPRPLLVFDGDCGFCRTWIGRWRRSIDGYVDVAPSQLVGADHPEVPPQRFVQSVVLIEPSGRVSYGAEAVFRALACAPRGGAGLWAYRHVVGFAPLTELAYRTVARHRNAAARLTGWLWGAHLVPPGDRLTTWVFVRMVGLVYLVAFASMSVQITGLIGQAGILPARALLDQVAANYGPERFLLIPSLAWIHPSDAFLLGLCIAGMVASALLVVGAAPGPLLLVVWALYLSTASVGGDFLWFQWDGLLLEMGIVTALVAPWKAWSRPEDRHAPPRAAAWLVRWLLFRLMFSSAVVKLASGDPTWRHLTALEFHYETQPLPPWTAWYAYQLPAWFQRFSALVMFLIEGLVPFLAFAPRRPRCFAAGALVFLQLLILITGNYGFFNWLALALCISLLDDAVWPGWLRRWARVESQATPSEAEPASSVDAVAPRESPHAALRPFSPTAITLVSWVMIVLGACPLLLSMRVPARSLGPLLHAYELVSPLRSVNSYGLFAVMTTERPEIIVEGSTDGAAWRPYGFRWKPGDPERRPAFVIGHMPRLDWQMWFAALGAGNPSPWFLSFCQRLLAGSKPVGALLAVDPFPDAPPRFIRATVYRYRFTDPATRRSTGAWWTRERVGPYVPTLTLDAGRLVPVEPQTRY